MLVKNMRLFLSMLIASASFLSGCSADGEPSHTSIQIVTDSSEIGPGPLHKGNIAIGGIYGSPNAKVGGVVRIIVNSPSTDKTKTNYGFNIGDKVGSLEKSFRKMYAYEPHEDTQTQTLYITGEENQEGFYLPSLMILTKNNVIVRMVLSND